MKNTMKIVTLGILLVVLVLALSGCSTVEKDDGLAKLSKRATLRNFSDAEITHPELVYDEETKIVYLYRFGSYREYLSPYYSENGCLCRYNTETGEIEEIVH